MIKKAIVCCTLFSSTLLLAIEQPKNFGIYIGTEAGIGSEDSGNFAPSAFIPIATGENGVTFVDLRSYMALNKMNSLNITTGYRHALRDDIVVGGNVSYDYAQSALGTNIHQLGLGAELFTKNDDLHINFYLPVSRESYHSVDGFAPYARLEDNQFKIITDVGYNEKALYGVGVDYTHHFMLGKGMDLSLSAGVSDYFSEGYDNIFNVNLGAQFEKDFSTQHTDGTLSLGAGYNASFNLTDRSLNGQNFYATAGVSLKIGKGSSPRNRTRDKDHLLTENVQRNQTPVVGLSDTFETVENGTATLGSYTFTNGAEISGSTSDIIAEIQGAGEGGLIVFNGNEGDINVATALNLEDGQVVLGSQTAVIVEGPNGETAVLILGGANASLVGSGNNDILVASNNNLIQNLTIKDGASGIVVGGTNNYLGNINFVGGVNGVVVNGDSNQLENLNIAVSGTGIVINSDDNIIANTTIDGGTTGMIIDGDNNSVDSLAVTNTQTAISANGVSGLSVTNSTLSNNDIGVEVKNSVNVTLNDLELDGNGIAVDFQNVSNANLEDLVITNGTNGIVIYDSSQIQITGLDSTDVANTAVEIELSNNVVLTDCQIVNSANGVKLINNGSSVEAYNCQLDGVDIGVTVAGGAANIHDLDISNFSTYGILVDGANNVALANINLQDGATGVYIANSNAVSADKMTITNMSGDGFYVVSSSEVELTDFEIDGATNGIRISDSSNVSIHSNTVDSEDVTQMQKMNITGTTSNGIKFSDSTGVTISDVAFDTAGGRSIYGENVSDYTISNNEFVDSHSSGLYVKNGDNGTISGNESSGTSIYVTGDNNTIADNTVNGTSRDGIKVVGDLNTVSGNTVSDVDGGYDSNYDIWWDYDWDNLGMNSGIEVVGDNNDITNNTVSNVSDSGVRVRGDNNDISGNNVSEVSGHAIMVDGTHGAVDRYGNAVGDDDVGNQNTISHNTISDSGRGIVMTSENSIVDKNNISNSDDIGIVAIYSRDLVITNNTISNTDNDEGNSWSGDGIYVTDTGGFIISDNNISDSADDGIDLNNVLDGVVSHNTIDGYGGDGIENTSTDVTFRNNTITN